MAYSYDNVVRIQGNAEFISKFMSFTKSKVDAWGQYGWRSNSILGEWLSFDGKLEYASVTASCHSIELNKISDCELRLHFSTTAMPVGIWLDLMSQLTPDVKFTLFYQFEIYGGGEMEFFDGNMTKRIEWDCPGDDDGCEDNCYIPEWVRTPAIETCVANPRAVLNSRRCKSVDVKDDDFMKV